MIAYKHFRGTYRAWIKPEQAQHVQTHTFYALRWDAIEIANVEAIAHRKIEQEKVGDYVYLPLLKARKKTKLGRLFQRGASDVVILGDENNAFSEDLEQVVLSGHSAGRKANQQSIRHAEHIHINHEYRCIEGIIHFSIPVGHYIEPKPVESIGNSPAIPVFDKPEHTRVEIPDLIVRPQSPTIPIPTPRDGAGFSGYLSALGKLIKWAFYLFIFFAFLGPISQVMRKRWSDSERVKTEDGQSSSGKPRLNPKQDTLAPVESWDYLTDHSIRWSDFIRNRFEANYSTSSKLFESSQRLHLPFSNPQTDDALQYWNSVYSEFSARDNRKLDSLVQHFTSLRSEKRLNPQETAEMVVTFIQEIPYCLIHDGTCAAASNMGGFLKKYHDEGKPCLPEIIAGVQTPYEFIHTLKGDCDTRSLLAYTLLSKMGIPASIWVSDAYGHSVLGVGLGSNSRNVKTIEGIRHAGVELTAKGFRLGMLSPEHGNMNNWNIALFNNQ
jgi:hypothetical protein